MATFLLIPGGGSDPSYWRFVVAELARRGHRGIAVDLPCEDDSADLAAYADAVAAQHTGGGRPIVVAHSFGGFTAPLACPLVDAAAVVYVSAMIPRPGERPDDWWSATGCAEAQRAAADRGGWDPDDMDAVFYDGVDPAIVAEEVERVQSETASRAPWPGPGLPDLPTSFVLLRDDRLFPEPFTRAMVADRLGTNRWSHPAGTWRCCRTRSNWSISSSLRPAPYFPPADPSSP